MRGNYSQSLAVSPSRTTLPRSGVPSKARISIQRKNTPSYKSAGTSDEAARSETRFTDGRLQEVPYRVEFPTILRSRPGNSQTLRTLLGAPPTRSGREVQHEVARACPGRGRRGRSYRSSVTAGFVMLSAWQGGFPQGFVPFFGTSCAISVTPGGVVTATKFRARRARSLTWNRRTNEL